jgi:hypothetical protein
MIDYNTLKKKTESLGKKRNYKIYRDYINKRIMFYVTVAIDEKREIFPLLLIKNLKKQNEIKKRK